MTQAAPTVDSFADTAPRVRRVLWIVLVLNAVVAVAKLAVGLLTGAVAMIADGFHSTMDASSNVVGLVGTKLADQPPDEDHPYGHRRYETLATLAIGGLLLVAAWEILQTMIDRVLNGGSPEVTPISFAVMLSTMVINAAVSFGERHQGRQLKSDILLADASHTTSDILVSLAVLISLIVTEMGYPWIDVIVALLIVIVIGRVGLGIISQTTNTLADHQTLDPQAVASAVQGVPGVEEIVRVRSRGPADAVNVDIDVRIKPATTTDHAYAIARTIKEQVGGAFPQVIETQVHFAPKRSTTTIDYSLEARAVADGLGLSVHEVIAVPVRDGVALEMHVEVPPGLTLAEAHSQVSELERRLYDRLPLVRDILTHIEPSAEQSAQLTLTQAAIELRDQALALANELYPDAGWHKPAIRLALGGYALTMHCCLPGTVHVEEAHAIAEHVETTIRDRLPSIQRVTIHTEPPDC